MCVILHATIRNGYLSCFSSSPSPYHWGFVLRVFLLQCFLNEISCTRMNQLRSRNFFSGGGGGGGGLECPYLRAWALVSPSLTFHVNRTNGDISLVFWKPNAKKTNPKTKKYAENICVNTPKPRERYTETRQPNTGTRPHGTQTTLRNIPKSKNAARERRGRRCVTNERKGGEGKRRIGLDRVGLDWSEEDRQAG